MKSCNSLILAMSEKYLGTTEIPGIIDNKIITKWLSGAGIKDPKDEIAWCAAAMNGILKECKLDGTGSALARSFMSWGEEIPWAQIQPGDIVILNRGQSAWQGHVGIYLDYNPIATLLKLRGGNQNNSYCDLWFHKDRILSIRRAIVA